MKSTPLLPSTDGRVLLFPYVHLIIINILSFSFSPLHGQQSNLDCNTLTPWTADDFSLDVEVSSNGLACWDGDPLCIILGNFVPDNVIDNDLNNFATGEILIGGSLTLSVSDPTHDYSAGNFAGFVISSGLLDLDLFSSIRLRTLLNNSPVDTFFGFDLIGLNSALFDGPYTIGFISDDDFDEIEITFAAGIVAGLYNVHYAVMEGFCEGPEPACNVETRMNSPVYPVIIDYAHTGSTGINLGEVDDPEDAISASTTDFASFENLANVLDTVSIAVAEQVTDYPAGTFVGFDIQNISVLGLDLLENMIITSYLNGVEQEVIVGNDLLLSVPLLSSTGRMTVGFVTTTAVDEVKFSIAYPLNVDLGITNIYSAIFRRFCEGPPLPCNELTSISSPGYPVYFNVENSGFTGAFCAGCTLEDPGDVIDNDPDSYAEIDITAGVATIGSLSVKDALTDYPANTFAGFHIENVQLVDLDVLTGITIRTYLDGNFSEQVTGEDILLTAGTDLLVNQGEFYAGFVTTAPFDEVQIRLTNVGMVNIGTTRIYEVVFTGFCPVDIVCDTNYFLTTPEFPVYIDFQRTGLDGGVCALCEVEDPDEVITASNTDYATIMITAGVAQTGSIAVRDALYVYPAGTIAGFVIDDVNDLLQADLFASLTISTYLDGDLQEFAFGANLIDAELLILFINPDAGVYNVGFMTTLPFDEIRITVGSLASVINIINVYGAFVDTHNSQGGDLACPDPPDAIDDAFTTPEDTPIDMPVLDNDSDPDSPLDIPSVIDPPSHGMVQVNPGDSTITYTPDPDFVGVDSFTYAICDNTPVPLCDTAVVVITVAPVMDTIEVMIPEDSTYTICVSELTVFTEPATSLSSCGEPADGNLSIIDTCATYTPGQDFTGQDTFCVVTCDPDNPMLCDTTIIIVTIEPDNDPPVAVDDNATTPEDMPVNIDVLDNDSDPDSPLGIPVITDPPSNGFATVNPGDSTITYTPVTDFVGIDSFSYEICDNGTPSLCDTATVIITVSPVIDTIIVNIPEDSSFTLCASELTTFTEPANSVSVCEDPTEGVVVVSDTCATYSPDPGYNGQDTFCLVTCDPNNPLLCDTTIVIVVIGPFNNPPVAVDDAATTPEDTPVNIMVLNNDSDPDSPLGTPVVTDQPSNGSTLVNPGDGSITYTPNSNFVGVDSFMYEICDSGIPIFCDTATVVITVTPVIDTIIVTIPEDSSFTVCVSELTVFTEPATSLALCDQPADGTASITDTCANYSPDQDFTGQDTFCLVTCDPNNPMLCDTTIVIVMVEPVNDPPLAVDDNATTPEDTPVTVDVLDNDSDPDSPLGTPVVTDQPDHGSTLVNPGDGSITYTPNSNFVGVDSFMYEICDSGIPVFCDTATVVITVTPVIDTIIVTIPEDSSFTVCVSELTVFTEPATSLALCDQPADGTASIVDTCTNYSPDQNFTGQDTFCLVTCDPNNPMLCDTTIVIVMVEPVNDPPLAVDDNATTPEDTPVTIDVLDNDSDPDSPLGTPVVTDQPDHGSTLVNPGDGSITYTPNTNFVGVDSFMYEICDSGIPVLCDTATVTITVLPATDTITVTIPEDSTVTVCASELSTFTEPAEAVAVCEDPGNGTVVVTDTCVTYTPDQGYNGQDTFCIVVCDPNNPLLCDTTIIVVIVDPFNNPPVAQDDAATTDEDSPVIIDVLENDSDVDSPLDIPEITEPPAHGMAVVNQADSTVTYTPDDDFVGVDTFTYIICDSGDPPPCDEAIVVVTILPVIDTIHVTIPQDSTYTVCADELTMFSSPANEIALCEDPSQGQVSVTGVCAAYSPDMGYTGQDTFCLFVCDPNNPALCDTTIVVMTISPQACVYINAFVYLEGAAVLPQEAGVFALPMRTSLNDIGVLPGQSYDDPFFGVQYSEPGQPYSIPPWNYMGSEGDGFDSEGNPANGDAGYPETVVDWILVSLRSDPEGTGGPACQAAALLHEDGSIGFIDEFTCCGLNTATPYYIVIEHRNHLIVMSDIPVSIEDDTLTYDFRNQQSYIFDPFGTNLFAGQKQIMTNVYAMYAGNGNQYPDPNADTDINFDDRTFWESTSGITGSYNAGDYNLNSDSNFNDRVVWERNNGKFTSVVRD
jgi:hypothetical protein